MENSQIHANPLGVGDPQQYLEADFQFHDMSAHDLATFQNMAPQQREQLKMDMQSEHMLPYHFEVERNEAQQAAPQQQQLGDNAQVMPQEAQSAAPLMIQSVEQVSSEGNRAATHSTTTDSPEDNRATRGGSQMAEGNYDDFGMNHPGSTDGNNPGQNQKLDGKSGTPAWTELKTKAGKERKRLPLACIACRRKKIRCSGEKPACKHCLRSRIPCVYKVTARKAAPRTDYMAMLDKRLRRMEERIIKIIPKEEQDLTGVTRAQVKPALPGTTPAKPAPKKRAAEEAFGTELDTWAQSTKLDSDGVVPASLMAQEKEDNRLLIEGREALPTQDIQEHLAEVFFDNLYGQAYHVLHKPSYMRKLR